MGIGLLALSVAFCFVFLIPVQNARKISIETEVLQPQTFEVHYTSTPESLNPLLGIQVNAESNGTLNFRIFDLDYYTVIGWLHQNRTLQTLEEFTAAHSSNLRENFNVSRGKIFVEIVPPKIENVTVTVMNPASSAVSWNYQTETVNVYASHSRLFLAITITVLLAVALTVPWLVTNLLKRRSMRLSHDTSQQSLFLLSKIERYFSIKID